MQEDSQCWKSDQYILYNSNGVVTNTKVERVKCCNQNRNCKMLQYWSLLFKIDTIQVAMHQMKRWHSTMVYNLKKITAIQENIVHYCSILARYKVVAHSTLGRMYVWGALVTGRICKRCLHKWINWMRPS